MVSIFFKPLLKIREHLIKGWHFSFLPLLVLVIRFTWEVGCVFLIPSNSAARRLALRAHSCHHGNQRIAVVPSQAPCATTQGYCSPGTSGESHANIPTKEGWLLFHWLSWASHVDCCITLGCASLPMQREWGMTSLLHKTYVQHQADPTPQKHRRESELILQLRNIVSIITIQPH